MEWEDKRAAFEAAKAIAKAPKFVDIAPPKGVKPATLWETKLLPNDAIVNAFLENAGRSAVIDVPVPQDEHGKPDAKAAAKLCESIKGRLMKVRTGESWAVRVIDGKMYMSYQGAVVSRGKAGAARKAAATGAAEATPEAPTEEPEEPGEDELAEADPAEAEATEATTETPAA